MHFSWIRKVGFLLVIFGVTLCIANVLGLMTNLGSYQEFEPRPSELLDLTLVSKTHSLAALLSEAESTIDNPTDKQSTMLSLHNLVARRFTNGDEAKYNFFSNWLMWSAGLAHEPLSFIRSPDALLANGYSALCSEQAYVLQSLAELFDIQTRHVGLNGHVVMEAWYENDWHMFDPDLEVIPAVDNGRILSVHELSLNPHIINSFYSHIADEAYTENIVNIFFTRSDNSFVLHDMVSKQLSYRLEGMSSYLKWLLPVMALLFGYFLIKVNKARKSCVA